MATRKGASDSDASIAAKQKTFEALEAMASTQTWVVYTVTAELTGPGPVDRDRQVRAFRAALGIWEHHEHLITHEGTRISGTIRTTLHSSNWEAEWKAKLKLTLENARLPVVAITYAIDELGTTIDPSSPSSEEQSHAIA